MLYVTGDTHGEIGRFIYRDSAINRVLNKNDILIITGDFGFVFEGDATEKTERKILAELPYIIAFVDGNHENFALLNNYPVEIWNGGKVHVIERNRGGDPKVIHLMRGQVFSIEGKKIFTFGGGNSIDKGFRLLYRSWWPEEMPSENDYKEAILNLNKHDYKVDYIITHAAPEDTMNLFFPNHIDEKPLNNFLEWVRENTTYTHWWFGHLHEDLDLPRNQTALWFQLRKTDTNEVFTDY